MEAIINKTFVLENRGRSRFWWITRKQVAESLSACSKYFIKSFCISKILYTVSAYIQLMLNHLHSTGNTRTISFFLAMTELWKSMLSSSFSRAKKQGFIFYLWHIQEIQLLMNYSFLCFFYFQGRSAGKDENIGFMSL